MREFFDSKEIADNKLIDVLMALFPVLFFIPLVAGRMKYSPYLRFRSNQAAILFLIQVVLLILGKVIGWISLFASVLKILNFVFLVFFLINLFNAISGNSRKMPLIGEIKIF